MCVCVSLHLSEIFVRLSAWCHIAACFFVDVVDFSLMTTLFCFISFIRYIIGNIFVVVLSVYVCVYLCISGIFVRLSASCHVATCFFVDVVDFSLVTTLFVLFH